MSMRVEEVCEWMVVEEAGVATRGVGWGGVIHAVRRASGGRLAWAAGVVMDKPAWEAMRRGAGDVTRRGAGEVSRWCLDDALDPSGESRASVDAHDAPAAGVLVWKPNFPCQQRQPGCGAPLFPASRGSRDVWSSPAPANEPA
jgi:hypothetical protein